VFLSRFAAHSNRIVLCALVVLFGLSAAHCNSSTSGNPVQSSATPTLSAISMNPMTISPGGSAQASVQLNAAASTSSPIALTSSNPSVATVPASVTVDAGSMSASFTVSGVAPGTATVAASLNGSRQAMQMTVSATSALASIGLATASVVGGNMVDATLALSSAAPAGGALVTLSAEDPATVPATVLVAAGSATLKFAVTTHSVHSASQARITATYAGASVSATLTVTPPAAAIASFGVTGATETDTCALTSGGAALDCTFNGSTSTAPGTITAWDWTYGAASTRSQTTSGPMLTNPPFSCNLLPSAPTPAGASLSMTVKLVVHDSLGNVSAESVHTDIRLLPQGACGY
jgi:hypothetical protein